MKEQKAPLKPVQAQPVVIPKNQIGLIGLGTMGSNLARNFASKKITTVVFNRTVEKTEEFIKEHGNQYLTGAKTMADFIARIERPRKIFIMVEAGQAVDAVIEGVVPYLEIGDTLVDCGNSFFKDTIRRYISLRTEGVNLIGCGISGGEEGALHGPSIMPGCSPKIWEHFKPFLQKIAAKDFEGKPCVTHIGTDGAGHFVKMVHNGIEYGIMQLIAETYDILRKGHNLPAVKIAAIFKQLNRGKLNSYLLDITAKVLSQKDEFNTKDFLINYVLDSAEQKGTGLWTVFEALKQNVPATTLTEAVYARMASSQKTLRVELSKIYPLKKTKAKAPSKRTIKTIEEALYSAIILTYAQGFELIHKVNQKYKWNVNFAEVARIWQGGCIIRAKILSTITKAYTDSPNTNFLATKLISKELSGNVASLGKLVGFSSEYRISLPAYYSALTYFNSMVEENSSANLIQGLRDYFGAHTYKRTDREGVFHTNWNQ